MIKKPLFVYSESFMMITLTVFNARSYA